ncbi:hypothetical protein KC343_g4455 [Hortaea werneckii]|nr:hypothetical protein KC352_g21617 [Hortaea werneckii]KAI7556994.1 hypothetical protein KC317_g11901 [Hortaea werneckii]KAI7604086.1 hypothetical protein KC346_g11618 [Hortaea werneckii]KAI7630713.1 hypothetical protein KC343_g4455 [Hortaea werneckii]KAI7659956.1 hypothetical protein KC319_g8771 [Hortaea werneckii]
MTSPASKKRSAPAPDESAVTTAVKRRRRTDFGNSSMITRSQALSAARNAVLQTTELLENILYFLPMKDLLFAQRVYGVARAYSALVKEPGVHRKLVKIKQEEYSQGRAGKVFQAAISNPLLCKAGEYSASSCFFGYYFGYAKSGAEIRTIAFPDDGNAGNVVGFVEEEEPSGRIMGWGGHVFTFPGVIFTTEEELEMDMLE